MILIGHRIQGPLGVISGALFVNCFWPKLDGPTELFAPGSAAIEVMGGTPRNVLFPPDTVFRSWMPDAMFPAEQAVLKAFPGRRYLVNLSPAEASVWMEAYEKACAELPPTASVHPTRHDCFFLRDRREKSRRTHILAEDSHTTLPDGSVTVLKAGSAIEKIKYDEFVCDVPLEHARKPHDELRKRFTQFRHITAKAS